MPTLHPARILTGNWPTTSVDLRAVTERLTGFCEKLHAKRRAPEPDSEIEAWLEPADWPSPLSVTETRRVQARARNFIERRDARLEVLPTKKGLGPQLTALARGGRAAFVSAHEADEIAAALHELAPWMETASCRVMKELRRRTAQGPGLAGAPPLILSGPPGIGKSAWARHLAELLGVPVIQIDVGAAQSGAFSLVGVERGWGTAGMGMLTQTILTERIANPVVIVDEIGLAREMLTTTGGTMAGLTWPRPPQRWRQPSANYTKRPIYYSYCALKNCGLSNPCAPSRGQHFRHACSHHVRHTRRTPWPFRACRAGGPRRGPSGIVRRRRAAVLCALSRREPHGPAP